MADSLFTKIRERHRQKVKGGGPSKVTLEMTQDRFLELMMEFCDEGEYDSLKRKIHDSVA